ncbi:unnamed protein product [Rhodiola kirilowii]
MAISVNTLFKERKYPFIITLLIVTLFILFSCVLILVFTSGSQLFHESNLPTLSEHTVILSSSSSPVADHSKSEPEPKTPPNSDVKNETKRNDVVSYDPELDPIDLGFRWRRCPGTVAVDYIPCLDNYKAIKALKSRKRMQHRERHCPDPSPDCLAPLPDGYRIPIRWPKSRDMIWYSNVPHPKLVDYKKDQNWVRKNGDYFEFPGGGTQFKDGVDTYVNLITKALPTIEWGTKIRTVLDVGCGVASFGGYLLERNVLTMSFAPKDGHEAQIQFALERGIPAFLAVIGTQQLTFPDNAYDLIHCARCRVHWHGDGGKPLLELNRVLRPGGFFVWSATPVYRVDEKHRTVWKTMVDLTKSMCWITVYKTLDSNRTGVVIYQKPLSSSCYSERERNDPPLCDYSNKPQKSWYVPLSRCISPLPKYGNWPAPWPERLKSEPPSLSSKINAKENFNEDTKHWSELVSNVYFEGLSIRWSEVRNIMDMNAGFGGFAAAIIDLPVWVMNVVPTDQPDTLSIIFDRGLIGTYHDWCESFNTYPRTYDLLHSSFLFTNLTKRCDIKYVVAEMDRIIRPGGWLVLQDSAEVIDKIVQILRSLHWTVSIFQDRFVVVGKKGFWRP